MERSLDREYIEQAKEQYVYISIRSWCWLKEWKKWVKNDYMNFDDIDFWWCGILGSPAYSSQQDDKNTTHADMLANLLNTQNFAYFKEKVSGLIG